MKVKVFSAVETVERGIHLYLRRRADCVELAVVNPQTGDRIVNGGIAFIHDNGHLFLCTHINPDIGLELDENGRIRLG